MRCCTYLIETRLCTLCHTAERRSAAQGPADRVLMYLTVYIQACLKKVPLPSAEWAHQRSPIRVESNRRARKPHQRGFVLHAPPSSE